MKIIALETSTQPGSIAACLAGTVQIERQLPSNQKTAESFANEMQSVLRELSWAPTDVDAIAICEGPGSFTGLRIGVTVAKTFAYATGASVVAPSTMRVLAQQARLQSNDEVWCVMDAQRRELFASLYRRNEDGGANVEVETTKIYTPTSWLKKIQPGQIVIGEGLKHVDSAQLHRVTIRDKTDWAPTSLALAAVAAEMLKNNETTDAWKLVPDYHRKSAAEEKLAGH